MWYETNTQSNDEFNFQEELEKYCKSDVLLLRQDCLKFKDFEAKTNLSPFDHPTTPSPCNRDLRMNRMEANTIASESIIGWRLNCNQSK